jgi:hypothetical protein
MVPPGLCSYQSTCKLSRACLFMSVHWSSHCFPRPTIHNPSLYFVCLQANISSNQDQDCQVLGRQLLQLVSSGHPDAKQAIATALRAGPPEPIPASA